MSDEYKFGLSDLEIGDDLDVALDNDTYQDQANPAPPVAGNYNLRALSLDYAKYRKGDNAGQPILADGKWPVFTIGVAEIVEGLGDGVTRKVALFQDVGTKPFNRMGTSASGIGDLTRAYGTRNWNGLREGIEVLQEAFEQQQLFAAQLDWSVYDAEFVATALEQFASQIPTNKADRDDDAKKLVNAIYREARVTGMRNFPYDAERGRFLHILQRESVTFKHPGTSANVTVDVPHRALEARPVITRYFPKVDVESNRVKFGPLNVKPAAQRAA